MGVLRAPERFLVAFSYAGEQTDLVSAMAERVGSSLGREHVFFAPWWEHWLAGVDADLTLKDVYRAAVVTVLCISERYGVKPWTLAEYEAIRARVMQSRTDMERLGVLPVRVGDGDIRGLEFNTIAPDLRERPPDGSARLVLDRLALLTGARAEDVASAAAAGYRAHVVRRGERLDSIAQRYLASAEEWRSIARLNGVLDPRALVPGDVLLVPPRRAAGRA